MRIIKFRGRCVGNGSWVYGDLRQNLLLKMAIIDEYTIDGDWKICDSHEVDPNTVGQFTGLKDKNGKEIYEGDVVKTKGGWGGIVLWNSRGYFYIKDSSFYEDEEPDLSPIGSLLCCERKRLEIIGNIHEKQQKNEH